MNQKLISLLEDQVNKEMYSAYLYLGISDYYAKEGFMGFSSYFKKQAMEEFEHATKFIEHLNDLDLDYSFKAIEKVENHFDSLKEPLTLQLTHEKYVTSLILKLYETSRDFGEIATKLFLEEFVKEQVEEEKRSRDLLKQFEFVSDDKTALLKLDKQLAKRD